MSDDTAASPAAADLAAWVQQAWDRHADQPQSVAAALQACAATLPADGDGAAAIGLAEHLWLSHLADADALAAWLDTLAPALGAAPVTAGALARARWVLATLAGRPAPPVEPVLRWRAMQNLWSAWVARGQAARALAMLRDEEAPTLVHPDSAARRALAASCNNLAVELRLGPRGDADRDALMLALAAASRRLWAAGGTWVNVERADYQLAWCHAVLGDGVRALAHARDCLAALESHAGEPEADAAELLFACEALAVAARAAGDTVAMVAARARMQALLPAVEPAMRPWCQQALVGLDGAQ